MRVELCSKGARISWCSSLWGPGRQCSWLRLAGSQWVRKVTLGQKKHCLLSNPFLLKMVRKGAGGGELEDPAWHVPLPDAPGRVMGGRQGSLWEWCPEMAGGLRSPVRGLGVMGDVAGGGGCRPRCGDFLTGGLFRDRYVWLGRSCVSGKKEQHVPGRGG